MGEKSGSSTRFLIALISISMLLLISSTMLLFHSDDNPFIPTSVYKFISSDEVLDSLVPPNDKKTNTDDVEETNESIPLDIRLSNQELSALETEEISITCDANQARLKVYMYDMPPEFHFGLLGWKGKLNKIWPDVGNISAVPSYPGGLNKQHSIEYWLTLDLLSSNNKNIARPCSAIRVQDSSQADVVFVPFFASLSYNRHSKPRGSKPSLDKELQDRLVEFFMNRREWRRYGGKDHVIVAHHPNSMLYARTRLGSARFILADFGRYPTEIANLKKDVIAPYKHVVPTNKGNGLDPFEQRPILAYFQGAIYRKDGGTIRQELYYLMKDEKDVHFTFGSLSQRNGAREASQGMESSKFCLNIAGDTPSSNRLFDAIVSHCVPVIISDEIELPYEDVLNYSEFSVFVLSSDAMKKGFLVKLLRGIKKAEWTKMWTRLKEVAHHFEYQFPSQQDDAVDMIWQAVARKLSGVSNNHRKRKYRNSKGVFEQ